jgi:hypothetical protein
MTHANGLIAISSRAMRLALWCLAIFFCSSVAQRVQAVNGMPSWTQDLSDARKDRYVDVSLNPALFQTAWYAPLGEFESSDDRGVVTDGQRVYRTSRRFPTDNKGYRVSAFDLADGHQVWEQPIYGYFHPHELGAPAVMNGVVYVNREGHSALSYEPELPHLFGLNAATGEIISQTVYQSQWGTKDRATLIDGHVIAAGGYFGGLYSFGPAGGIQWFNNKGGDTEVSVVADGKIYRALGDVLSVATGQALPGITHPQGLTLNNPMISEDGVLFYTTYNSLDPSNDSDRRIAKFDLATHTHLGDISFPDINVAMAAGDGRLAVSYPGGIRFFDLASGANYANWDAAAPYYSDDMVLTNSHLFIHVGQTIQAINVLTGASDWTFSNYSGELSLGDGYLFISGDFGVTAISLGVPEPSVLSLLLFGIAISARVVRRR